MSVSKYYMAVHTLRLSEDDSVKEAGDNIESYVDNLLNDYRVVCARAATLKLQRDAERLTPTPKGR